METPPACSIPVRHAGVGPRTSVKTTNSDFDVCVRAVLAKGSSPAAPVPGRTAAAAQRGCCDSDSGLLEGAQSAQQAVPHAQQRWEVAGGLEGVAAAQKVGRMAASAWDQAGGSRVWD